LWASIIISLDGIDTDDFFRQYMCGILTRKIPKSKLVEQFKKYYLRNVKNTELLGEFSYYSDWDKTEEDEEDASEYAEDDDELIDLKSKPDIRLSIEDFLKKISLASSCYRKIIRHEFPSNKINRRLKNLESILSMPSYIYLMFFLQGDDDENTKLEVLRMIEAFMLRRHICNKRTSENDNIFSRLLRLRGVDILVQIKSQLLEDYPDDIEFEDSFSKHDFAGILIPRAKYVLSEIEYFMRGNTGEFTLNSGNEVHLEHIIPEKIKPSNWKRKYGDWESYLGENAVFRHKKLVNKIGNMTLLAGQLNISASNNPFIAKKECYNQSDITLTQQLVEYSDFKFEHLEARGAKLTETAMKIWRL